MPLGARSAAKWAEAQRRTRAGRASLRAASDADHTAKAMASLSTLDADEDDDDDAALMDDADPDDEDEQPDELLIDEDEDDEDAEEGDEEGEDADDDEGEDEEEDDEDDEEEEEEMDEEDSLADSSADEAEQAAATSNKSAARNGRTARTAPSSTDGSAAEDEEDDDDLTPEQIAAMNKGRGPRLEIEGEAEAPRSHDDGRNLAELSDSSADEGEDGQSVRNRNRIGKVPLEWYADEEHIGYDVTGKKIVKSNKGDKLDQLLARMDDPNWKSEQQQMHSMQSGESLRANDDAHACFLLALSSLLVLQSHDLRSRQRCVGCVDQRRVGYADSFAQGSVRARELQPFERRLHAAVVHGGDSTRGAGTEHRTQASIHPLQVGGEDRRQVCARHAQRLDEAAE